MATVIQEFQTLIERFYSPVCFEVEPGDDPVGTYLIGTVDIDDPDEVVDVYVEKLLTLQVEGGSAFVHRFGSSGLRGAERLNQVVICLPIGLVYS